jgi:Ca2+-binding EF-hand superfamily protein
MKEKQLKEFASASFAKYDVNNNGFLELDEIANFVRDALEHINPNRNASNEEI